MNKYVIDTNIFEWISDRSHPHHTNCTRRLAMLADTDIVCFPISAAYEVQYGIANFPPETFAAKEKVTLALDSALATFFIANLSTTGASIYGELKSKFKIHFKTSKENIKKHNFDILLASISIDHSAILVSNDGIFKQLSSLDSRLTMTDWTLP